MGEGETDSSLQRQAEVAELEDLLAESGLPEDRTRLLYDLGVFHWREAKPAAWSVFDSAAKDFDELCDDMECLGGLRAAGDQRAVKRSVEREYSYPPQETKLNAGASAQFAKEDGFKSVTITGLDRSRCRIRLKMGPRSGSRLPDRLDLLPTFALNSKPIPGAIRRVIADQCGARTNRAAEDLLSRNPPRFEGALPLPLNENMETLEGLVSAVRCLDCSILPVQGPPGTGKTYLAARAILALVGDGKRVAVSSNSHEAIRNVLMGCYEALCEGHMGLTAEDLFIVHKIGRDTDLAPEVREAICCVTSNDASAIRLAHVVGGTAWLFAREELANTFDYLFVDEAGQVSLANLTAMSNAADNLVLVGDPRQLPQVLQGRASTSGKSVLPRLDSWRGAQCRAGERDIPAGDTADAPRPLRLCLFAILRGAAAGSPIEFATDCGGSRSSPYRSLACFRSARRSRPDMP